MTTGLADSPVHPPAVTYTLAEAARAAHLSRSSVTSLCRRGVIDAVQVDGWWLLDGASLTAWLERPTVVRRRGSRRLDAWPLLRQVELAGGRAACGVERNTAEDKALDRAAIEGTLTVRAADQLAVRLLGLTPWEVWGEAYAA